MIRMPRVARQHWTGSHRAGSARTAVLLGVVTIAVASCASGAIGASTAVSNGQSFVGGSYSSKYVSPGARAAAPDFSGTTLTGQRFSLASDRGDVVVLNFWGSWCAPCRAEAYPLAALAKHFASAPVRFVGDDVHDYATAATAFEHTFGITYPSLNDPGAEVALAFHSTLPPTAIPSTLVIDRSGRIAARVIGEVSYDGLLALIARVLADKS